MCDWRQMFQTKMFQTKKLWFCLMHCRKFCQNIVFASCAGLEFGSEQWCCFKDYPKFGPKNGSAQWNAKSMLVVVFLQCSPAQICRNWVLRSNLPRLLIDFCPTYWVSQSIYNAKCCPASGRRLISCGIQKRHNVCARGLAMWSRNCQQHCSVNFVRLEKPLVCRCQQIICHICHILIIHSCTCNMYQSCLPSQPHWK